MRARLAALVLVLCPAARLAAGQQQTDAPAGVSVPAPPAAASARANAAQSGARVFRVRVLDGRNGAAMERARVTLWYDESAGSGYVLETDRNGVALMPQPAGQPLRVLLRADSQVDCRRTQRDQPPTGFNLQQLALHGAAAENTCGNAAVRPQPGELILYVRPRRWYEGLNQ